MSAVMQSRIFPSSRRTSLRALLKGIVGDSTLQSVAEVEICDISSDSREIGPGGLFIAVPGLKSHGLEYASRAVQRGAVALCWEPSGDIRPPLMNIVSVAVPELSKHVGELADRFFGEPSAALRIAAITGTNGKTTTAHLLATACETLGLHGGYLGTLGYGPIRTLRPSAYTTPDCITVHRHLAELREAQIGALGMEVSSHALEQNRIDRVRVDTAVFTNLSRDHLDYHGTMEAYGAAKARLFDWPGLRCSVINTSDVFGRTLLAARRGGRAIAYSLGSRYSGAADQYLYAARVRATEHGIELDIDGDFGTSTLRSPLLGEFNAENLLAAAGVLLSWDVSLPDVVRVLEQATAPAGRMELHSGGGKRAVIDYAHTPDALEKALRALRQHCRGKLICVFGCGGDRDRGKRPLMGGVADRLADRVIVTDDNPRSEDPGEIVANILAGIRRADEIVVEHDRQSAISMALAMCGRDDLVLVAGKGHEDYQIIGRETRHFSDREVVQQILRGTA